MKQKYEVNKLEQNINFFWKKNNIYRLKKYKINKSIIKNICILLPPPNITGILHLGHALQYTLMDIIIRYHQMLKNNILWQSGVDHAGIATQLVVEKLLKKKKISNYNQKIISSIKILKIKNVNKIKNQMKYLGCCINWNNYRFTMDKQYSIAVNTAFIKLYENGFIYKAKKLVNWDPVLKTAISDLEVENIFIKGFIWYIKYIVLNTNYLPDDININKQYIIISTTRPETLLGDVAIAVNFKDIRYKHLIGKFAIVPIINRIIPIISDNYVKINKYSGVLKITPGHDFNDYELAIKHKLPIIKIFDKKAISYRLIKIYKHYLDNNPIYEYIPKELQNLDRFILRKKIIEKLQLLKLIFKIDKDIIKKSINSRNNVIIESRLTNQWFLKTNNLAKLAIKIVEDKQIVFLSPIYKNIYFSWLKNIKDWCISRQIIWGHKIPIWYDINKNIYVGINELSIRNKYNLNNNIILKQEKDVLDTWFSSSLWSFASLGWPKYNYLIKKFLPTTILISGFDIIFFWIVRMIIMNMYFIKDKLGNPQIPFKKIFITGLICDKKGKKMSKSIGNVIDPIDLIQGIKLKHLIIKKVKELNINNKQSINKIIIQTKKEYPKGISAYGADSLRLTLASLSMINSRVIKWNMNKLNSYKFLCNKLWNVSRFILLNIKKIPLIDNYYQKLSIIDWWILIKLNLTNKIITKSLNNYKFDKLVNVLYKFIKTYFCDWYLELVKPIITKKVLFNDEKIKVIQLTLIKLLQKILKISHPIIPYITEYIWQEINLILFNCNKITSIFNSYFPIYNKKFIKSNIIDNTIHYFQIIIIGCRNLRNSRKINNKILFKSIILLNINKKLKLYIIKFKALLINLLKTNDIEFNNYKLNKYNYSSIEIIIKNIKFFVIINNKYLLNTEKKDIKNKLLKKIKKIKIIINLLKNKLNNNNFVKNAPKLIIKKFLKNYKNNIKIINILKNQLI